MTALIDSSVWIEYLCDDPSTDCIDADGVLLISVLSLFEVQKKLLREKFTAEKIKHCMTFIKKRCLVVPLTTEIAERAAEFSHKHRLPAIDALIYATAVAHHASLMTLDNDFRGLPGVAVL